MNSPSDQPGGPATDPSTALARSVDRLVQLLEDERRERKERERDAYDRRHIGRRSRGHFIGEILTATSLTTIPGYISLWKKVVPEEFWIEDRGEAVVACPCGGEPRIPLNRQAGCEGCDRSFIYTGADVHACKASDFEPEREAAKPA